jgi:hypothetical protein
MDAHPINLPSAAVASKVGPFFVVVFLSRGSKPYHAGVFNSAGDRITGTPSSQSAEKSLETGIRFAEKALQRGQGAERPTFGPRRMEKLRRLGIVR